MRKKLLAIFILFGFTLCNAQIKNPEYLTNDGYAKAHNRQYTEALKQFNDIITANPEFAPAYAGRAFVKNLLEDNDEAMKDVYKALSINNNLAMAYYVRGRILVAQKEYKKSIIDFNTAIDFDPKLLVAICGKINAYILDDDVKKAQSILSKEIENNPQHGDFYYYEGKIYASKNQYDKALEMYDKALDLNVEIDKFDIYLNRGDAKQNLNLLIEAKEDFNRAISINSLHASPYHGRGVVHYKLGEYDQALEDFQKSIKIIDQNPKRYEKNSETYYNLGMTYYRKDDLMKACPNFHMGCGLGNSNSCKMVILRCTNVK